MKDRELKNGKVKIKTEIEELLFKPAIVSIVDMDNFEEKEMKKMKNERKIKLLMFYLMLVFKVLNRLVYS